MVNKVRSVVKAISEDAALLREFLNDPAAVADRFDLSEADRARLIRSDLLVTRAINPLVKVDVFQTTRPITITGHPPGASINSGDPIAPQTLEELSHDDLLEVTRRVLVDAEYASRVRAFLGM